MSASAIAAVLIPIALSLGVSAVYDIGYGNDAQYSAASTNALIDKILKKALLKGESKYQEIIDKIVQGLGRVPGLAAQNAYDHAMQKYRQQKDTLRNSLDEANAAYDLAIAKSATAEAQSQLFSKNKKKKIQSEAVKIVKTAETALQNDLAKLGSKENK